MATVYFNRRYVSDRLARVPVSDPALQWGVGLFEVMRGYGRTPFRLADHVGRLCSSADRLGIPAAVPDLTRVIPRLFERNRLPGGYCRIMVTGGGNLVVETRPYERPDSEIYERGARITRGRWRRDRRTPLAGHKTLNYLDLTLTRRAAEKRGFLDALICSPEGEILEGTRSNLFVVSRGAVHTPPGARGVLPGITRKTVLALLQKMGVRTRQARITMSDVETAEEVFVTSSMMEVVPVRQIDGSRFGRPGALTRELLSAYREQVVRECGCWP